MRRSRSSLSLLGAAASLVIAAVVLAACGGGDSRATSRTSSTTSAHHTSTSAAGGSPSTTVNIYAADGPNLLAPATRNMPYRVYVPESGGDHVDIIDPNTFKVIDRYLSGENPQHIVPAWNLETLYATNDLGNSLTAINPYTSLRQGPNIPVTDPYNMYFTPDGKYAIVVEEARQILAFRNPSTWAVEKTIPVDCAGVDHGDFSADGTFAIFSCEFSSKLVKIDLTNYTVAGYLTLAGSDPQDVKLDSAGQVFYVADMTRGGVYEISASTFKSIGYLLTGRMAHGLYVSRDGKSMYVTDRGEGAISVIDLATRTVEAKWKIPGGGSPDMGNLSPDGKVLWVSGRYNNCVYAISTVDGHLIAKIPVPDSPHGLSVWPQPGRYSLGHTGIMR